MQMDYIKLLEVAITFGALIFTAIQVYLLSKQIKENNRWNRINATFTYCKSFNTIFDKISDSLINKLQLLVYNSDTTLKHSDHEILLNDDTYRKHLLNLVTFYEELSVGIEHNFYDENITKEIMYAQFISHYKILTPYINIRRKEINIRVCSNFEAVANRWINEKQRI